MEYLDLYDIHGNLLNKVIARGDKNFEDGEYIKLAVIWLKCKDKYLIQKSSVEKGSDYAVTGGHVTTGFTSREQAVVELNEELGITVDKDELIYLGTIVRGSHAMFDVYLYEDDNLENTTFEYQVEEVESAKWYETNEIDELIAKGLFRASSTLHYEKFIKNK